MMTSLSRLNESLLDRRENGCLYCQGHLGTITMMMIQLQLLTSMNLFMIMMMILMMVMMIMMIIMMIVMMIGQMMMMMMMIMVMMMMMMPPPLNSVIHSPSCPVATTLEKVGK